MEELLKSHPDYRLLLTSRSDISNPVFSSIINSNDPTILRVDELAEKPGMPPYIHFWKEAGFKQVLGLPLRAGGSNVGVIIFPVDNNILLNLKTNLLQSVCAQLAVAVSNILASERIAKRKEERELLLSLNIDIMTVRDYDELLLVATRRLKDYLRFSSIHFAKLNSDKTSISPFPTVLPSKRKNQTDHPLFNTESSLPVDDGILNVAVATAMPMAIDLEQWKGKQPIPSYLRINNNTRINQLVVIRFSRGHTVLGFLIFFFENKIVLDKNQSSLFADIANQISIAVSNIRANNEIKGREAEKSRLLAFSNAIASVRDKSSLSKILNQEIKGLLGINEYAIHVLSEDKKTHRPVFFDAEAEFAKHPVFLDLIRKDTDVNDGIFNTILASDEPISFEAQQWITLENPPVYANAAIDIGLKKLTGVRIHVGDENIAVLNFRHDDGIMTPAQYPLLKSICSQIAVAISNIMANEKILHQLTEIHKYKQQLEEEKGYLKEEIETSRNFSELIGESAEMKKIFALVTKVAPSDSTVLILGETGTGKELVARAIHNSSPRRNKLMVKVNCAALPANLIESELFGHERGSFTGALDRRIGKFELANGGTLFLDEIGEMPLELQVKLLRALQEKEIERLGGKTTLKVDVRIIAATNRDLEKLMEDGRFRSDLFYRLNVFPIHLPPLRNRREDILPLASHFIRLFVKKTGRKISGIGKKATEELVQYSWPGNIRELEHLIERSVLLSSGELLNEIHLPSPKKSGPLSIAEKFTISSIDDNERSHILNTLKYTNGRIAGEGGAAELLGIPPSTLNSKMKRLGIKRQHSDKSGQ